MAKNLFQNATGAGPGRSWNRGGDVVKSGIVSARNTGAGTANINLRNGHTNALIAQIAVPASGGAEPIEVALPACYYAELADITLTVDVTAWVDGDDT